MQGKKGSGSVIAISVIAVLFVASLVANGYLYFQYRALLADPQRQARQETMDLVSAVGKVMALPENEEPTIATVADTEKLKDQAFFVNAQVDDKVLLYTTAKKAILYRPSTNMIIEVAPINLGNTQTTTPTTTTDDQAQAPATP